MTTGPDDETPEALWAEGVLCFCGATCEDDCECGSVGYVKSVN